MHYHGFHDSHLRHVMIPDPGHFHLALFRFRQESLDVDEESLGSPGPVGAVKESGSMEDTFDDLPPFLSSDPDPLDIDGGTTGLYPAHADRPDTDDVACGVPIGTNTGG